MASDFPLESARAIEYEKDPDKLSRAIDMHLDHARERKWTRALQWFRNAAYLSGQHMDQFRYQGGTFTQNAVVIPDRFRDVMGPTMVDNHILRIQQANLAELTGMNPYPQVEPASEDPDDQDLAKIGELIAQVLWEKPLRVPEKLRLLVGYLSITGTAAVEVHFGPRGVMREQLKRKLAEIPDLVAGKMVKDYVETDETEWVEALGLVMKVWSGFHIDVNPDATSDPDSLTWVCRSTFEDVGVVQRMFDKDEKGYRKDALKQIVAAEHTNDPLWHWETIKDLVDSPEGHRPLSVDRGIRRALGECARVRVIDTRPNLDHPRGRTIIQAGGKVVWLGDSRSWSEQYPERWTPMRIARWWTLPGRFEGIPLISPLVPLQKRVDAIDVIIRLNRQHLGVGSLLIPRNCGVPAGFIGPVPGQNVPYKPGPRGEKPERLEPPQLTSDVWNERAGCVESMNRIGGIASAQISSSPSALRAGVMLDFGQRQALQSKSAVLLDFDSFLGDVVQDVLQEVSRSMPEDPELMRRVRVAARKLGDLAIDRFTSLDLRDNVRVRIDLRSQMLQTPEAKKESAATFLQFAGQQITQVERAKVAKAMGLDELQGEASSQYKRVRRMVERVFQGQIEAAVPIDGVDDPGIFSEVLREAVGSERALMAPEDVKRALKALLDQYAERQQQAMAGMAQAIQEQTDRPVGLDTGSGTGQAQPA